MFLIAKGDEEEISKIDADRELAHQSRVFAADLHNQLRLFRALFEVQEKNEQEVEEFVPESEADVARMLAEVKRLNLGRIED